MNQSTYSIAFSVTDTNVGRSRAAARKTITDILATVEEDLRMAGFVVPELTLNATVAEVISRG